MRFKGPFGLLPRTWPWAAYEEARASTGTTWLRCGVLQRVVEAQADAFEHGTRAPVQVSLSTLESVAQS